ncbi:MAG: hypothetical protein NVSMB12_07890 [Acidimicrobiales bacterium]
MLVPRLSPDGLGWPAVNDPNPFVRYAALLLADAPDRARALAHRVEAVAGRSAEPTRIVELVPGTVAKVEAEGIAGSHKWRHLFGTLLALGDGGRGNQSLAIASCGNAALAAAVLAAAVGRSLEVFVPTWADPLVVDHLTALGAQVTVAARQTGELGDPCVRRFRDAVAKGAVPFTCQGTDNALALDGGRTLAWELVDQLGAIVPDHVVLQAGGGALASCVVRGLAEAFQLGALPAMPRVHVVQAEHAAPLVRAWARVSALAADVGWDRACQRAGAQRPDFMWPWTEPRSIATGIVDDETYDWLEIVRNVAASGGSIFAVTDGARSTASIAATRSAGTPVGPTGAAGYAGILDLQARGTEGTFVTVLTGST